MKPYLRTGMVLLATAFVMVVALSSCSSHSEGVSFTNELDIIDSFISTGETKEALSLLNKVSKDAYSSFARIGIYKRYMTLGEKDRAEKVLKKGLKKIPNNPELTAVYTQFLLREGRVDEALERSRTLSGTDYGSLYAEAVFRAAQDRGSDAASVFVPKKKYTPPKKNKKLEEATVPFSLPEFFKTDAFIKVYTDAWRGTKQSSWLRNAAVLHMQQGDYADAVLIVPEQMADAEDSLFWGMVYYDSGRYGESLAALLQAPAVSFTTDEKLSTLPEEIAALEADNYFILGDEDSSQKEREVLLLSAAPDIAQYEAELRNPLAAPKLNKRLRTLIPVVYINNARFAYLHADIVGEYNMLMKLVQTFPEYVPGLSAYGQFALDTLRRPPEDSILQELRAAGLETMLMEKNDALPKIKVESALSRINNVLRIHKVPGLIVLKEELHDEIDTTTTSAEHIAHIWQLLEENSVGTNLYPPEIMRYAVTRLIALGAKDKAQVLFNDFLHAEYGDKFDKPAEKPELLALWEAEVAAWFAADSNNIADSRRLYEYVVESLADRTPSINSTAENSSVVNAYINLAVIYSNSNNDSRALELLTSANARTGDPVRKSEILYRMAVISNADGDRQSAVRSLQYALSLNPSLNKANLMLKTLK